MKNGNRHDPLEQAVAALRSSPQEIIDLSGFERGVWNEIAIRDEGSRGRSSGLLDQGRTVLPAPTAAVCASVAVAVAVGIVAGLHQATVYEKDTALALEQRYVESIHPVMMSMGHAENGPAE